MIEVENLSVKFGDFEAVKNISFSVKKGEIFGFLGANGAGKTTTIRVLCGLLNPTSGSILIENNSFKNNLTELKKRVGYMSQKFTLYDDLSVNENFKFAASLHRLSSPFFEKRKSELLDMIGFKKNLKTLVRDLPGGLKQEVSLATSVLHDPNLIFLDEPTAGVSPLARLRFWKLIRSLAEAQKTIFVTTHYMDEAEQCDRIALMQTGSLVALDSSENLKRTHFPHGILELSSLSDTKNSFIINALLNEPSIKTIQAYGLRYHLFLNEGRAELPKKIYDQISTYFHIEKKKASLEDVFLHLVEKNLSEDIVNPNSALDSDSTSNSASNLDSNSELDLDLSLASNSNSNLISDSLPVFEVPHNIESSLSSKEISFKNTFQIHRVFSMIRKETAHILRDPFTLLMALGLPLFLLSLFGLVIDLDVKNIHLGIEDKDQTYTSRSIVQTFTETGLFHKLIFPSELSAEKNIQNEKAKAFLIIEKGFEKKIQSHQNPEIQILIDGSDNSAVGSILFYINGIYKSILTNNLSIKKNRENFSTANAAIGTSTNPANPTNVTSSAVSSVVSSATSAAPATENQVQIITQNLYNPELKSTNFIVPGLAVIILAIVSILLTALTVAREWENGSMELLLSTPLTPLEIILGKLAPYTVIGLFSLFMIYAMARWGFAVPFRGSHFTFLLGSGLFITAYLAQGLLISVLTRQQQVAMQVSMISGLLPSILLSGFLFPTENMPLFFRILTMIFPARWFMIISRDQFLKGSSLIELKEPFFALSLICFILIFVSSKKFKKDLEP